MALERGSKNFTSGVGGRLPMVVMAPAAHRRLARLASHVVASAPAGADARPESELAYERLVCPLPSAPLTSRPRVAGSAGLYM